MRWIQYRALVKYSFSFHQVFDSTVKAGNMEFNLCIWSVLWLKLMQFIHPSINCTLRSLNDYDILVIITLSINYTMADKQPPVSPAPSYRWFLYVGRKWYGDRELWFGCSVVWYGCQRNATAAGTGASAAKVQLLSQWGMLPVGFGT